MPRRPRVSSSVANNHHRLMPPSLEGHVLLEPISPLLQDIFYFFPSPLIFLPIKSILISPVINISSISLWCPTPFQGQPCSFFECMLEADKIYSNSLLSKLADLFPLVSPVYDTRFPLRPWWGRPH